MEAKVKPGSERNVSDVRYKFSVRDSTGHLSGARTEIGILTSAMSMRKLIFPEGGQLSGAGNYRGVNCIWK